MPTCQHAIRGMLQAAQTVHTVQARYQRTASHLSISSFHTDVTESFIQRFHHPLAAAPLVLYRICSVREAPLLSLLHQNLVTSTPAHRSASSFSTHVLFLVKLYWGLWRLSSPAGPPPPPSRPNDAAQGTHTTEIRSTYLNQELVFGQSLDWCYQKVLYVEFVAQFHLPAGEVAVILHSHPVRSGLVFAEGQVNAEFGFLSKREEGNTRKEY